MKASKPRNFTANDFRNELKWVLPGYKWTVSRNRWNGQRLVVTGKQSSGLNRISTLVIERQDGGERSLYSAKIWGYGLAAPSIAEASDCSLRRALRALQDYCNKRAAEFNSANNCIEWARKHELEAPK